MLADKAYSTAKIRTFLRARGIKATIPQPVNQVNGRIAKGSAGARPPAFEKQLYRNRNTVQRAINLLRGYRAVATPYDCEFVYKGTIDVASIKIWLRDLSATVHGTRPRLRISVDLGTTVVTATWSDEATPWIS